MYRGAEKRDRGGHAGERFEVARLFKQTFGRSIPVHFVGVWDTVSSYGWFWWPISLPYSRRNPDIRHARHAVAIDERRAFFRQNLMEKAAADQDLVELWFAGAHADVGGGYPENESGLSQLALEWMASEASALGLRVNSERRAEVLGGKPPYVRPDWHAPIHNSAVGWWRLLEFVPRFRWRSDGQYVWRMISLRPAADQRMRSFILPCVRSWKTAAVTCSRREPIGTLVRD